MTTMTIISRIVSYAVNSQNTLNSAVVVCRYEYILSACTAHCVLRRRTPHIYGHTATATTMTNNKKLSYRRGTARCVVSIEILPIATQQCRNYLDDKS